MRFEQTSKLKHHRLNSEKKSGDRKRLLQVLWVLVYVCMAFSAYGVSSEAARRLLEHARENLRISQATEKRIVSELEQLKQSANASPQVINDYEIYLQRVQAMVAENRKIVREMESTYARYGRSEIKSSSASSDEMKNMLDPQIPEQQNVDELAALDSELNDSLSEFDEMLLKELDLIQAKSAERMQDLAQEAAAAAKRLREKGIDLDSPADESAESEAKETAEESESDADKESTDNQGEQASKEGEGDNQVAKSDSSRQGAEGTPRKQSGHGSGEDDDIVARQLREAAENETDPELKEKLWKEYEDYKKNTSD